MGVDPLDHGCVQPDPAREDEAAAVATAEVDLAGPEVVGEPDQVLGGVDHIIGDAERPADHIGRSAGKDGDGHVGPGQPVGHLVEGSVAAKGDDDVVAAVAGLPADLDGVLRGLGVDRLDVVAGLERVDHEVLEPVRHRRGVRVDDDQHSLLVRVWCERGGRGRRGGVSLGRGHRRRHDLF